MGASRFLSSVFHWRTFMLLLSTSCCKQCFSDHSPMCALRLPYIPLLGPSLGSGDAEQILCVLNIFVSVVKLCFFLNVLPSISSFPSPLLTALVAFNSCPCNLECPALWNIPNPVDRPLQWPPKAHGISPSSFFWQWMSSMTAPPSVLILSLMANLCFRWFSECTAVFFCIECHLLLNALGHGLLHLSGLQKTVSATAFPRLDHHLQEVISISISIVIQ